MGTTVSQDEKDWEAKILKDAIAAGKGRPGNTTTRI
jgi:hypothetical protein